MRRYIVNESAARAIETGKTSAGRLRQQLLGFVVLAGVAFALLHIVA